MSAKGGDQLATAPRANPISRETITAVFAYAHRVTGDASDAEDLSQQILEIAVRALRQNRDIRDLRRWMIGVCRNQSYQWLRMRERSREVLFAREYFDSLEQVPDEDDLQLLRVVRGEIEKLSRQWRDVTIGHYLEGKTCQQLAAELGVSEGTIKWRLSEARRMIKERLEMKIIPEKEFARRRLSVGSVGSVDPEMHRRVSSLRLLPQNVLLASYRTATTVEQLADGLGVTAAYVEDEITWLEQTGLIQKAHRNEFQTSFLIRTTDMDSDLGRTRGEFASRISTGIIEQVLRVEESCLDLFELSSGTDPHLLRWALLPLSLSVALRTTSPVGPKEFAAIPALSEGRRYLFVGVEEADNGRQEWYSGPYSEGYWALDTVWTGIRAGLFSRVDFSLLRKLVEPRRTDSLTPGEKESIPALAESSLLRVETGLAWSRMPYISKPNLAKLVDALTKAGETLLGDLGSYVARVSRVISERTPSHLSDRAHFLVSSEAYGVVIDILRTALDRQALPQIKEDDRNIASAFLTDADIVPDM